MKGNLGHNILIMDLFIYILLCGHHKVMIRRKERVMTWREMISRFLMITILKRERNDS